MWSLQNKLNSVNAQKWYSLNHIRSVPVISLVLIIVMMMVSFTSAEIKYPPERVNLVAQDGNTLLSHDFLPFLNECSNSNVVVSIPLCTMYYDMVYNAYQLGSKGNDTKEAIQKANQELDKPGVIKEFCDIFRNETINTLDKQPFSQVNGFNATQWVQSEDHCKANCLQPSNKPPDFDNEIKQVCKFISGGYRWISEQKKKQFLANLPVQNLSPISNPVQSETSSNKVDAGNVAVNQDLNEANKQLKPIGNGVASPVNPNLPVVSDPNTIVKPNQSASSASSASSSVVKPSAKVPEQVSKPIEGSVPAVPQPPKLSPANVTPSLNNKTSTASVNASKPGNNIIENKIVVPPPKQTQPPVDIQSEDEGLDVDKTKTDFEDENPDNDDETEEDPHNEEQDIPLSELSNNNNNNNVNNMHNTPSRLSANQVPFHGDKESSFFPYFMFLMFVVVTFYVAYHNKSKILALLIEGRRSRSYSSRGGGRRKQHSAEYRKLDSNLEEAIQSDGGHVLSTQIIY